jgi:Mg-chelatase subunit ChlI
VEVADGGTLFLDEVGEMSPEIQSKFLRVLDSGTFYRVGATRKRRADFRLVAATNRDLREEVAEGRFRKDLYYRIHGVRVVIPPCVIGRRRAALVSTSIAASESQTFLFRGPEGLAARLARQRRSCTSRWAACPLSDGTRSRKPTCPEILERGDAARPRGSTAAVRRRRRGQ